MDIGALKILLADYHTMFRQGLKAFLEEKGFRVVGEASNGREAVALAREVTPDVAVIDFAMPELNGIRAAEEIRGSGLKTRIVLLAMHDDTSYVVEALRAHVRGYILKAQAGDELVSCITEVARGGIYLSPTLSRTVMDVYFNRREVPADSLSKRERQVVRWIAEGKRTREIAKLLGLSPKTIESHRSRIMRKLDIHETAGLVRFAIRHHLTEI